MAWFKSKNKDNILLTEEENDYIANLPWNKYKLERRKAYNACKVEMHTMHMKLFLAVILI